MLICTSACRQKTYKHKKSHLKRRIAKPYYLDLSIKSKNETMNMCVNAYIKRWKTVLNEQKNRLPLHIKTTEKHTASQSIEIL